ncbi:MAG: type II toxin-antitoxin system VapC family toxin [Solirubrobacterales bacterium]|nr:type II toxin-antitoxin system VapC family toxin [Solirubrobacterales bacterium]
MRVLLDTHAALWWLTDDLRLSESAREAIAAAEEPFFSAGTLFEVSIKASLGKLEVPEEWAEELLAEGFSLLPVSLAHAHAYCELPYVELDGEPQRDPFDRLLVAQAEVEGAPIVTRDPGIAAHGIPTIW